MVRRSAIIFYETAVLVVPAAASSTSSLSPNPEHTGPEAQTCSTWPKKRLTGKVMFIRRGVPCRHRKSGENLLVAPVVVEVLVVPLSATAAP